MEVKTGLSKIDALNDFIDQCNDLINHGSDTSDTKEEVDRRSRCHLEAHVIICKALIDSRKKASEIDTIFLGSLKQAITASLIKSGANFDTKEMLDESPK